MEKQIGSWLCFGVNLFWDSFGLGAWASWAPKDNRGITVWMGPLYAFVGFTKPTVDRIM